MNMHTPAYSPALWRAEVNVGFLLVLLSVLYFETTGAVFFLPFETSPFEFPQRVLFMHVEEKAKKT